MHTILVTNDDGLHSEGILHLARAMKGLGDTYVVAPDRERSACSHAITIHKPLKVADHGDNVFGISGTPTDCIAVGVEKLLPRRPSLIVSGINHGPNLGDDITYSGTVSAAIEGTILNIPSFAVSLAAWRDSEMHFKTAAEVSLRIAKYIIEKSLPYDTLLNVNVPNREMENIGGIRFTRQGRRVYEGAIRETFSPWGEKCYWIGGGRPFWEHGEDTDMSAVENGFVSVTPIHLDLTNHEALSLIRGGWDAWSIENSGN